MGVVMGPQEPPCQVGDTIAVPLGANLAYVMHVTWMERQHGAAMWRFRGQLVRVVTMGEWPGRLDMAHGEMEADMLDEERQEWDAAQERLAKGEI